MVLTSSRGWLFHRLPGGIDLKDESGNVGHF
jgi:hypothetical protein